MSARHHGGPTLPRCDFEQNLPSPKLSFSICCTRWLSWILQSPIWDTWLHGRIQQGTRTGDFGAQYPVCPLGLPHRNRALQHPRAAPPAQAARASPGSVQAPALPQLPARRGRSQRSPRRLCLTGQWRRRAVAEQFDGTRRADSGRRDERRVIDGREQRRSCSWRCRAWRRPGGPREVVWDVCVTALSFIHKWPVFIECPLQSLPFGSRHSVSLSQGCCKFWFVKCCCFFPPYFVVVVLF